MAPSNPQTARKKPQKVTTPRIKQKTSGAGWRVRWYVAGQQKERAFRTRAEADNWAASIVTARNNGERFGSDGVPDSWNRPKSTVAAAVDEYVSAVSADWAEGTRRLVLHYLARFTETISNTDVGQLTHQKVAAAFTAACQRKDGTGPVGKVSRNSTRVQVAAFMRWMLEVGYVDEDLMPATASRRRASTVNDWEVDVHALPSVDEAWGWINRIEHEDTHLAAEIILRIGLRPGEVRALHSSDLRQTTVRVSRTANHNGLSKTTKTGKHRDVPCPDDLLERLRERPDGYLFPGRGDNDVVAQSHFGVRWRKVGAPFRMHDLRHIHATVMLRENVAVTQAAAWLGHSPAVLLRTYASVLSDMDVRDRVDAALSPALRATPQGPTLGP